MESSKIELSEVHWLLDMLQSIDVGLVVLDRNYCVQVWNGFMMNHSGLPPQQVIGQPFLKLFPDVPGDWFRRKVESVRLLKNRAFTTWEQRPYLLRFKNYRPITGAAEYMYQNITFIPLTSITGEVEHIGVVITDVTDIAIGQRDLEAANQELGHLSRTDRLTQLNNRGYWEESLEHEFRRLKRTHRPGTLVMFDIDHFKKVNDTYGHPAGDEVIRQTAAMLRQTMRTTDVAGRYGGEEFVVLLVETPAEGAHTFAERLRATIAALTIRHDQHEIRYTISLGVAEVSMQLETPKQWIECADRALYEAKHGGRNCVRQYQYPAAP
ncbi:MAG TPA: diguanylate cyclase [Acidiferrobacterales bacterium]|nr:diguanylate cyclase [Acidiferrobacterales bacterium]